MKINIKRLLRPALVVGFMVLCASAYGQCYRVYIKMYADHTYHEMIGGTEDATKQAMRNVMTNDMLNLYQSLGVEFVVLPAVVYKTAASDPFNNVDTREELKTKMGSVFGNTIGGFTTVNGVPSFRYNMNVLFFGKPIISATPNTSTLIGEVVDIGNLYSNAAHAWITKRSIRCEPVIDPVTNIPIPGVCENKTVTLDDPQHQRTLAHEVGHLFGANHDNVTHPELCGIPSSPLMCTGGLNYTFSAQSRSDINNRLIVQYDASSPTLTLNTNQTWNSVAAYSATGRLELASGTFFANAALRVIIKSKKEIKLTANAQFKTSSNSFMAMIIDPAMYDCATQASGGSASGLRMATQEEIEEIAQLDGPDDLLAEDNNSAYVTPNPFSGVTTLRFTQVKQGKINVDVYNALGQVVQEIMPQQEFSPGQHAIEIDMTAQKTGLYFIQFSSNGQSKRIRAIHQ